MEKRAAGARHDGFLTAAAFDVFCELCSCSAPCMAGVYWKLLGTFERQFKA